jgi:hypothetical protein
MHNCFSFVLAQQVSWNLMNCNIENYPIDNNVESNICAKSVLQIVNDEDIRLLWEV